MASARRSISPSTPWHAGCSTSAVTDHHLVVELGHAVPNLDPLEVVAGHIHRLEVLHQAAIVERVAEGAGRLGRMGSLLRRAVPRRRDGGAEIARAHRAAGSLYRGHMARPAVDQSVAVRAWAS